MDHVGLDNARGSRPNHDRHNRAWPDIDPGLRSPAHSKIALRLRSARNRLWLLTLFAAVCCVYVFYASAGGLSRWPVYGVYHDFVADGFRLGQLHMTLDPHPNLLKAKDPYSFANSRYWAIDASYYAGKYYAYWGPVPAVLQAVAKSVLGIHRTIGDHYMSLFSVCVGFFSGGLLIERMARHLFGIASKLLVAICCVAFAFANPVLHGVTTGGTYHTAILAGQAWLLAGLVPAFDAVWLAGSRRTTRICMVLAGTGWALALGSRVSLLPGIAGFIAATAVLEAWASKQRFRQIIANSLWLGVPVALAGFGLLAFNKLRFDEWLNFGSKIQLSHFPLRMSSDYILTNLYTYSLRPFVASCEFPFIFQVWRMDARAAFPADFEFPEGHLILEPVIGWLRAVPITWLIPFVFVCAPRPFRLDRREVRAFTWCIAAFGALSTLTGLIDTAIYTATMRYLSDVSNGLVLLGILGGLALWTRLRRHDFGRRAATSAITVLSIATAVMGLLIGYQGYNGHFARYNPSLDAQLVKALSFCGGKPANLPAFTP